MIEQGAVPLVTGEQALTHDATTTTWPWEGSVTSALRVTSREGQQPVESDVPSVSPVLAQGGQPGQGVGFCPSGYV